MSYPASFSKAISLALSLCLQLLVTALLAREPPEQPNQPSKSRQNIASISGSGEVLVLYSLRSELPTRGHEMNQPLVHWQRLQHWNIPETNVPSQAIVYVVDDDESVRRATARLLKTIGIRVETFSSAREFLDHDRGEGPGCLVLDVRMPGLSGLDLQQELAVAGSDLPIVFISAHGDIPMSVRAMKAGAVDFLPKPFDDQKLLDAVGQAIDRHTLARRSDAKLCDIRSRIESLTHREREVLDLVADGLMNKQIASRLGITQPTVKVHRRHVMEKMAARSVAELARMLEKSGVSTPKG